MSKSSPEEAQAPVATLPEGVAGRYCHLLDTQKRITMPSVWRSLIPEKAVMLVVPDPDKERLILLLPSMTQSTQNKTHVQGGEIISPEADDAADFYSQCENVKVDDAGRMKIGDWLLDYAKITEAVLLKGGRDRIYLTAINKEEVKEKKKTVDVDALRKSMIKWGLKK